MTLQDREFADKVLREYPQMPEGLLLDMIERLRIILRENRRTRSFTKGDPAELLLLDAPKFTIHTTGGDVTIDEQHIYYPEFVKALAKARKILQDKAGDFEAYMNEMAIDYPFKVVCLLIDRSKLGAFQKYVIVGMFIVHFGISKTEIMAEKQWKQSPASDVSYKHYLVKIVKSRLKKDFNRSAIFI